MKASRTFPAAFEDDSETATQNVDSIVAEIKDGGSPQPFATRKHLDVYSSESERPLVVLILIVVTSRTSCYQEGKRRQTSARAKTCLTFCSQRDSSCLFHLLLDFASCVSSRAASRTFHGTWQTKRQKKKKKKAQAQSVTDTMLLQDLDTMIVVKCSLGFDLSAPFHQVMAQHASANTRNQTRTSNWS